MKTMGVFLPVGYRGGSFNGAKNIAKMLHLGSRSCNEPVKVVFSCISGFYDLQKDFDDLLSLGISVHETKWTTVGKKEVARMQKLSGHQSGALLDETYQLPRDGAYDFTDCDLWLMISDRFFKPLAPIKPYGMVIYDYIQRYCPDIFDAEFDDASFITTTRHADFVLTTTPATRNDAIQYAGLSANRVHLAPMEFEPFCYAPGPKKIADDYFIWPTNSTAHKNHLRAIDALDIYYHQLNGRLKTAMTGYFTELFMPGTQSDYDYCMAVGERIQKSRSCEKNIMFLGHVSSEDYISTLSHAQFLWHPTLIDNGTYSVVEAAYYGVPSLSNRYPQMHFMNERFSLNLTFCDATDAMDTALQLKEMEENSTAKRKLLPTRETLDAFSYSSVAQDFWQLFRSLTPCKR